MDTSAIQKRIDQLDKLVEEVRVQREMLKGEMENDDSYLEAAEAVKMAVAKRKGIRDEIIGKGANQEIVSNMKNNTEEITTLREILSAELFEFYQENKTEMVAGRKLKIAVKLLPKNSNSEKRNGFGQYSGE